MLDASSTGPAQTVGSVFSEIRRWLSSGRLQTHNGGYCAWRDMARDDLSFEYPEITGYALTWMAAQVDSSEPEIAAARRAADWMSCRLESGDRSARAGWDDGSVYTFDLGMIAAGLISFGRVVGVDRYVAQGEELAHSLAGYISEAGHLPTVAPDGPQSSRPSQWSTTGRVHLVKCVQSLLLAGEDDAALVLVRSTLEDQAEDGRFPTQPNQPLVMLHPHIYAVEGLWMWATARHDQAAAARARLATEWTWRHQLPTGGFPRWVSEEGVGPEQLDVTSQAIRGALLIGFEPRGLEAALSRLVSSAQPDGGHGLALTYQPEDRALHLNAWTTMFGGQALMLAALGPDAVRWHELV